MTRTLPNRFATHATATIPPVAYPNAIADAVSFLHSQLRNPDMDIAMTAAMALLDLEKTRMRHGQPVPQIAAGSPAHTFSRDAESSERSAPGRRDNEDREPIGDAALRSEDSASRQNKSKPAEIGGTDQPVDDPTHAMSFDQIMADPEMRDVIRQTRRQLERADPDAVLTDESVGRMVYARMRELRARGG